MDTIVINCSGIAQESEFWRVYVETVKPEGGDFFGRNLAAFNDAVTGGGPGWPGESPLHFIHTESLRSINGGEFYRRLLEIASESPVAAIRFG